jgi:hypothetical protein
MSVIGNLGKTILKKFAISLIFITGIRARMIITTIVQAKTYNVIVSIFNLFVSLKVYMLFHFFYCQVSKTSQVSNPCTL